MKRVVFDICDTLYYSNTTFDFLRFILTIRKDKRANAKLKPYLKKTLTYYRLAIVEKLTGKEIIRAKALETLSGCTQKQLNEWATAFVSEYLPNKTIQETHQALLKEKALGHDIILASNSIEPVVAAIAQKLNVSKYISSTLKYKDGKFEGKIDIASNGKKLDIIHSQFGENYDELSVFSDNFSDFQLMQFASERFCVVHKKEDMGFWKKLNPHFIEVGK